MISRLLALLAATLLIATPTHASAKPESLRLYTLDCGHIEFKDLGAFADDDSYAGKPGSMSAPCFLIVHPNGTLLWDTGLGDAIALKSDGVTVDAMGIRLTVPVTLRSQLEQLGLSTNGIDFVAVSHLHLDHVGNLSLFPDATWLIGQTELSWAQGTPAPIGVDQSLIASAKLAKIRSVDGDDDVFGDGTVRILRAPGHTPGHKVLLLNLQHAGAVILSGDLWHSRENFERSRMPVFNVNRADTMASFDRIRQMLANHRARLIIQHEAQDLAELPKFPAYLD